LIATSFGVTFAAEWKAVNTGLTNMEIRSLAIDPARPTIVYAGTQNGLFKSLDGGTTWRSSGLPDRATTHLVIDFVNPSIVYAATQITSTAYYCYERVLFKSTDGGATWKRLPPRYPSHPHFWDDVAAIAINPLAPNILCRRLEVSGPEWRFQECRRGRDMEPNRPDGHECHRAGD
jgi:hypothetical protein